MPLDVRGGFLRGVPLLDLEWNADLKSASNGTVRKIAGHSASGDAADFKSALHGDATSEFLKLRSCIPLKLANLAFP
jgi:hypothetical protein